MYVTLKDKFHEKYKKSYIVIKSSAVLNEIVSTHLNQTTTDFNQIRFHQALKQTTRANEPRLLRLMGGATYILNHRSIS